MKDTLGEACTTALKRPQSALGNASTAGRAPNAASSATGPWAHDALISSSDQSFVRDAWPLSPKVLERWK
jgi:hypothetical protein